MPTANRRRISTRILDFVGSGGGGDPGGGDPGGGDPSLPPAATDLASLMAGLATIAADAVMTPAGLVYYTGRRMWLKGVGQHVYADVASSTGFYCDSWDEGIMGAIGDRFIPVPGLNGGKGAECLADGTITSRGLYRPAGTGAGTQATGKRLTWGVVATAPLGVSCFALSVGAPTDGSTHAGMGILVTGGQLMATSGGGYLLGKSGPTVGNNARSAWVCISPKSHYLHEGIGRDSVWMPHCYNTLDRSQAEDTFGARASNYLDFVYGSMMPEGGADRAVYLNPASAQFFIADGTAHISFVHQGDGTLTRWQNRYLNDFLETHAGAYRETAPLVVQWGDSLFDQRENGLNLVLVRPSGYPTMDVFNHGVTGIGWKEMRALFDDREGRNDFSARIRVAMTAGEYINETAVAADHADVVAWLKRYRALGTNVRFAPWLPRLAYMATPAPSGSGAPTYGAFMRADFIARCGTDWEAVDSFADNPNVGDSARAAYETAHGVGTFDPFLWNDTTHCKPEGYARAQWDVDGSDAASYTAVSGTGGKCFPFDRGCAKYLLEVA